MASYRSWHPVQIEAVLFIIFSGMVTVLEPPSFASMQSYKALERLPERLVPLAAPGQHIQRKIIGFIGAPGPVTLDIVQGKQENYEDQHPITARVCIVGAGAKSCYVPRTQYNTFYVLVKAETLEIAPGQRALLLGTGSYQYVEPWILLSVLVIGRGGRLINILPHFIIGPEDEGKFWHDVASSPYLLTTKAVAIWMSDDNGQFGNHRYWVITYEYCPEMRLYVETNFIVLSKKFPSIDPLHKQNFVINRVIPTIKTRLLRRKPRCAK